MFAGLSNDLVSILTTQKRALLTIVVYTGLAIGIGQIGIVSGPLLGGVFTEHATWRWCFYINLPMGGLAAIFLFFITVPEQIPKKPISGPYLMSLLPRFDLTGFVIFAPASIMILLALQWGAGDYGWNSSQVIGLFCGGGVLAILFVFWERHMGDDAMIPPSMVSLTVVWSSAMFFALLMVVVIVGSNFLPIYLQSIKGLSPTMSGVYMLASIISQLICILISGALVTKFGYYLPWCLVAAAITTVGAGLISTWEASTSLGKLLGYQVLLGARGLGMQMVSISLLFGITRNC